MREGDRASQADARTWLARDRSPLRSARLRGTTGVYPTIPIIPESRQIAVSMLGDDGKRSKQSLALLPSRRDSRLWKSH